MADVDGDFEEDQRASGGGGGTAVIGTPSPYINITPPAEDKTFGAATPLVQNDTGYPDAIFQTERYSGVANPDNMQWSFPTGDGTFQVNLLFNENWVNENNVAANYRIFDVQIEDQLVLDDYRPSGDGTDVNIAKVESFLAIVSDGTLNIDFILGNQNPALKGIEILNFTPVSGEGPIVTNPGAQVGVEGDAVNLQILAIDGTDPSCGPLTYTAENLPANIAIDPSTGLLSGILLEGTGSGAAGAFIESNGLVIMEAETDFVDTPGGWNLVNEGAVDFLVASTNHFGNTTGQAITYNMEITSPGVYRFHMKSNISGTVTTDENDSWFKVNNTSDVHFFAVDGGTLANTAEFENILGGGSSSKTIYYPAAILKIGLITVMRTPEIVDTLKYIAVVVVEISGLGKLLTIMVFLSMPIFRMQAPIPFPCLSVQLVIK